MSDGTTDEDVAAALSRIATQIKYLGVGDAASTMGAIEHLAVQVKEGSERIADALHAIAAAIADHGGERIVLEEDGAKLLQDPVVF
jgi:hypothetical protein